MNLIIFNHTKNSLIRNENLMLCFLVSIISSKKMKFVRYLLEFMKSNNITDGKIYESILQVYLFCGFPATIESLKIFNNIFPNFKKPKYVFNQEKYINRGLLTCKKIYTSNYYKLMENFSKLSNELKEWMIIEGYGKVIGRKGLSLKTRELLNVSILATNYYEHQLYSHIKGSLNTGANYHEITNVIELTKHFGGNRNYRKSINIAREVFRKMGKVTIEC